MVHNAAVAAAGDSGLSGRLVPAQRAALRAWAGVPVVVEHLETASSESPRPGSPHGRRGWGGRRAAAGDALTYAAAAAGAGGRGVVCGAGCTANEGWWGCYAAMNRFLDSSLSKAGNPAISATATQMAARSAAAAHSSCPSPAPRPRPVVSRALGHAVQQKCSIRACCRAPPTGVMNRTQHLSRARWHPCNQTAIYILLLSSCSCSVLTVSVLVQVVVGSADFVETEVMLIPTSIYDKNLSI
jgi:hypothetical protein